MSYTATLPDLGYLSIRAQHWDQTCWDRQTRDACEKYLGYVPTRNGLEVTFQNEHDVTLFYLCCFNNKNTGAVSEHSGGGNFTITPILNEKGNVLDWYVTE